MTRLEFLDDIQYFSELMEVASDAGYYFEDVYDEEQYNDAIDTAIQEYGYTWEDLRDYLRQLPVGYDYYTRDEWGDWEGHADCEIDDLKDQFLNWADMEDYFDEENGEDEDSEKTEDEENPDESFESGLTLEDFFESARETCTPQ